MITASTSLTIFIMNIHFCGAEAKPVPHWAKVLIIDYMSKIFFVYEVGENCTTPESERTPLYPEEPSDMGAYHDDCFHDIYDHESTSYKYSNGHGIHHHNKKQPNGNANHNNHASRMDRAERMQESTQHYHHIKRDELDYEAPPHPRYLQHLNGGLKEPLLYPPEKLQVPACPCCCPCLQHKQVDQHTVLFLHLLTLPSSLITLLFFSARFSSPISLSLRWWRMSSSLPTASVSSELLVSRQRSGRRLQRWWTGFLCGSFLWWSSSWASSSSPRPHDTVCHLFIMVMMAFILCHWQTTQQSPHFTSM